MTIQPKIPDLSLARMKKGFSQRRLALVASLSSAFISQLESGQRSVGPESAKKICEALEVELEDIFFVEGVHKRKQSKSSSAVNSYSTKSI